MPLQVRQLSIWIWPVAAIVMVAVSGQIFGLLGAVIGAGCSAAALLFSAAEVVRTHRARRLATMGVLSFVLIVIALFVLQGALPWSRSVRTRETEPVVDARGSRLTADQLGSSNFRGAQLAGADLTGVDMRRRDLAGATAQGATLRGADLSGTSLRGADLRGADLDGACLDSADLTGADLTGARVSGATIAVPKDTAVVGTPLPLGTRAASCRT